MTGTGTVFHEAGVEAAALLAELHRLGFEDTPERIWAEKEFTALLAMPGTFALCCSEGEQPAGFVLVRHIADEAEILTITILPDCRRRGLGARMMGYLAVMLRQERQVRKVFLEVREDNQGALALYRRLGFSDIGHRPNYYRGRDGSPRDALVMSLELN